MTQPKGRSLPLSPSRRLVADLMTFSRRTPTIVAERRMRLAELVAARRTWQNRPAWSAIFLTAYATVSARRPVLRRSFMAFPRPHLYEHPCNVASVTIERSLAGEEAVFFAQLRSPESRSVAELDFFLRQCKEAPLEEIGAFRRALRQGRTPWPLRPALWWLAFNLSGKQRSRLLGTFGLTSIGAFGAGLTRIVTPLTTNLHFGLLDERGDLDVRLSIDHRVLDGATGARALVELDDVLIHETLDELRRPVVSLAG
jgi:hypothetical protein